jgi:LCP family protein required for cell wall assembly
VDVDTTDDDAREEPTEVVGPAELEAPTEVLDPVVPQQRSSLLGKVFRGAGRTALVIMSVTVLAGSGYAWRGAQYLNNGIATTNVFDTAGSQPTDGAGAGLTAPTLTTDQNILLVGMDSRTDAHGNPLPASDFTMLNAGPDTGEMNTDTMILVHIPAGGGQATAISFPRDSYVQIAGGYGKHRLNSAFAYAYNAEKNQLRAQGHTDAAQIEVQAKESGRQNLVATIENLIGDAVTINRYAEVNLYGFYQLSEAVGGVQVCLKAATYDDQTHAHFPAGEQTVSGVQALNFVRERHDLPGGDLDRIVRQQVFLGALAKQILSAGTLASPSRLDGLISAVQSAVTISSGWDIFTFAQEMQGLSSGAVQFLTIPTGGGITVGGADMLEVSQSKVAQFVRELMTDGVTPAGATSSADTPGATTPTDTAADPTTPSTGSGAIGSTDPTDTNGSDTTDTTADGSQVITADGTPCVN